MPGSVVIELEVPKELRRLKFPRALDRRLQHLLDLQSQEGKLSKADREEAESLVELAEMLTLLRLKAERGRRAS